MKSFVWCQINVHPRFLIFRYFSNSPEINRITRLRQSKNNKCSVSTLRLRACIFIAKFPAKIRTPQQARSVVSCDPCFAFPPFILTARFTKILSYFPPIPVYFDEIQLNTTKVTVNKQTIHS